MRKENILYSCVSLDRENWKPIKQTDLSDLGDTLYVGLFVADKDGDCFVEFDDVYVNCDEDHPKNRLNLHDRSDRRKPKRKNKKEININEEKQGLEHKISGIFLDDSAKPG